MSKNIQIDKSYVDFENTNYEDVFIYEEGWNALCTLAKETNFGIHATRVEKELLQESYSLMILGYLYSVLEIYGYTSEGILLEIIPKTTFLIKVSEVPYPYWKDYPGKWQYWLK